MRPTHTWGEANFAAVADGLASSGLRIVLVARASEAHVVEQVASRMREHAANLAGKTDLAGCLSASLANRLIFITLPFVWQIGTTIA